MNTHKDHKYEVYTDIKLSNVAKDPSFLREVLSYQILRQYMDAPLSNYANVYVNGTLIGLYSNSESISKKFVDDRFGSKKNTFVKCNPPAGAGPGRYLIVWADNDDGIQTGLHANFKLSSAAESLYLSDPSGTLIGEVSFSNQETDNAYARFPNGTGNFQVLAPTFNSENVQSTSIYEIGDTKINIYPNPVSSILYIEVIGDLNFEAKVYNLNGQLIYTQQNQNYLEVLNFENGFYFLEINEVI